MGKVRVREKGRGCKLQASNSVQELPLRPPAHNSGPGWPPRSRVRGIPFDARSSLQESPGPGWRPGWGAQQGTPAPRALHSQSHWDVSWACRWEHIFLHHPPPQDLEKLTWEGQCLDREAPRIPMVHRCPTGRPGHTEGHSRPGPCFKLPFLFG